MDIDNITCIKSYMIKRKIADTSFNPVFYMLLAEKFPGIFP